MASNMHYLIKSAQLIAVWQIKRTAIIGCAVESAFTRFAMIVITVKMVMRCRILKHRKLELLMRVALLVATAC